MPLQPPPPPVAGAPAAPSAITPWVRVWQPRPAARLRLICLHPAGAGPLFFRPWAARLPEEIEVLAVNLPGREGRIAEEPVTDYARLVTELHAALRPLLAAPYALFGHSMGALLAYGLAREAVRHGDPAPARLIVSGVAGPGKAVWHRGRANWTDEQLVADLRAMGGTPEAVLAEPDLLAMVLPILRADSEVCDAFHAAAPFPEPRLECPISILGGTADDVTEEELAGWADVTGGPSSLQTFPGGHFFLSEESADAVLLSVAAELADAGGRDGVPSA